TLHWMAGRWQTDPFYSHGPLVPIVSAFLLWRGRDRLRLDPAISIPGIALLVGGAALHLLGVRLMFELLSAVSLLVLLAAVAHLSGGPALLRAVSFPLL